MCIRVGSRSHVKLNPQRKLTDVGNNCRKNLPPPALVARDLQNNLEREAGTPESFKESFRIIGASLTLHGEGMRSNGKQFQRQGY